MSVFPGFGGQSFIENSIDRIARARELIDSLNSHCLLGIDGGIKIPISVQLFLRGRIFALWVQGYFIVTIT